MQADPFVASISMLEETPYSLEPQTTSGSNCLFNAG
jgi:hypothetical protein